MKLVFKIIFTLSFLALLFFHLFNFQLHFFKFSSSPLINEYNLQKLFFVMVFCELLLPISIWTYKFKFINILGDLAALFYFPLTIIMLLKIKEITGGCIPCHISIFEPYGVKYHAILFTLIFLAISYMFIKHIQSKAVSQ